MFHVVLHRPEIPPNTGNVIRLCANTGCQLHLVQPLGFRMDDADLKRAGLDYHEYVAVEQHADLGACIARLLEVGSGRMFAFSARRAGIALGEARFQPGDALLFGQESSGLPDEVLDDIADDRRVRLPMLPGQRSLNLSNAVAVVVFEAWRQNGYSGGF
jgi:tRNA (cytidine/uridine-2'-O-)-methyltransferase